MVARLKIASELATKQEGRREDLEDVVRQLREDFEERLDEMEAKLSKSVQLDKKTLEDERDVMRELRQRFKVVGQKVNDGVDQADDLVRDHPVLAVGGALAVGLVLGALLSRKSRD